MYLRLTRKKRQAAFTLLEILIASGLLLFVMGVAMRFLGQFNATSNRTILRTNMEEQLRQTADRLERELIEGSAVLVTDGGSPVANTSKNVLVLSVPLYTSSGFLRYDSTGKAITDTIVLKAINDNSTSRIRKGTVAPQKLVFSLTPAAGSNRNNIVNQTIVKNLMPKSAEKYQYPDGSVKNYGSFTYLKSDGTEPASSAEYNLVTQIRVTLLTEQDYGGEPVGAKKEFEVRLRNWRNPSP